MKKLVFSLIVMLIAFTCPAPSQVAVQFVWHSSFASGLPSTYHLQVASDVAFGTVVFDYPGLTDTTKTTAATLSILTTYYWRVNATNSVGTSPWSSVWSFTTAGVVPAAPALILPLNGATGIKY